MRPLDVLVSNAGTGQHALVVELDLATWRQVLEVDLTGGFVVCQAAARRMIDQGRDGRIITVTSVHEHPRYGAAAYCAAKGGLGLFTSASPSSWPSTASPPTRCRARSARR